MMPRPGLAADRPRIRLRQADRALLERLRRPGESYADAVHRLLEEADQASAVARHLAAIEARLARVEQVLAGERPAPVPTPENAASGQEELLRRQLERLRSSPFLSGGDDHVA